MSQDVPVFRSDAPHQVAVPQPGADAVSPSPASGPGGPLRQITDSKVFAPLDEPTQLGDIEIPPDRLLEGGARWPDDSVPQVPAVVTPIEPERPEVRARRIRRLSPDLVARALEIRADTESISSTVDAVIASLPDFELSDTAMPEASDSPPESSQGASQLKEST